MRVTRGIGAMISVALLASCGSGMQKPPADHADMMFPDQTPVQVITRIAGMCARQGHDVLMQSESRVVCQTEIKDNPALARTLTQGQKASVPPFGAIHFISMREDGGTRVLVYTFAETITADGTVEKAKASFPGVLQKTVQGLQALGARRLD